MEAMKICYFSNRKWIGGHEVVDEFSLITAAIITLKINNENKHFVSQ